ncbi:MAG: hypothetical protein ACPGYX_03840 [Oceanobacter sp.]
MTALLAACSDGGQSSSRTANTTQTEVTRTPDPATFSVGNAVADINAWMTAWTLNDLVKTAGHEEQEYAHDSSMWIPHIEGIGYYDRSLEVITDASGWPTTLTLSNGDQADSLAFGVLGSAGDLADAYATGTYVLTYEGEGQFSFNGMTVISESAGQINLDYSGNQVVQVHITETDPEATGNYLRNLQLLRPDSVEGERFNADYLDFVRPFSVIRPLHMSGEPNTYGFADENGERSYFQGDGAWGKRPQLSDSHWGGAMGSPWEVIIDLANQSQSDLWINLPIAADDAYLTQLAQLVLEQLDSERVLYIELGNELWNWDAPYAFGRAYAFEQAQLRWPDVLNSVTSYSDGDPVSEPMMTFSWQAARTLEAAAIFDSVWGQQSERIAVVLAGQIGASVPGWDYNRMLLEAPVLVGEEGTAMPGTLVDALAIGTYFGEPHEVESLAFDRSSVEAYLADAVRYINGESPYDESSEEAGLRYQVRNDKMLADEFNLPLVSYEGGQHFIGDAYVRDEVNVHTDMYDAYRALFSMWQEEGGGLFVHLNGIIPRGGFEPDPEYFESENFGIKETQTATEAEAPKWHAVMDVMRETGQLAD